MANNGGEPLVKLDPEGTAPILSYNVAQLSAFSAIFDHRGDIHRDFVETRDIDGEQYQRINPICSPPTRIPRGNPDAIKEIPVQSNIQLVIFCTMAVLKDEFMYTRG